MCSPCSSLVYAAARANASSWPCGCSPQRGNRCRASARPWTPMVTGTRKQTSRSQAPRRGGEPRARDSPPARSNTPPAPGPGGGRGPPVRWAKPPAQGKGGGLEEAPQGQGGAEQDAEHGQGGLAARVGGRRRGVVVRRAEPGRGHGDRGVWLKHGRPSETGEGEAALTCLGRQLHFTCP